MPGRARPQRPYDPYRRRTPHWQTLEELKALLAKYARWYAEGCDDRTITERIQELSRGLPAWPEGAHEPETVVLSGPSKWERPY